jgi:PA14 domain
MAATCSNHVLDVGETDVDCGGSCAPCELGRKCEVTADCATGVCSRSGGSGTGGTDAATSDGAITDGAGQEAMVSDASEVTDAVVEPTDAAASSDATPQEAAAGDAALSEVGVPEAGGAKICRLPDCTDGAMDGSETDVDCGGSCAPCRDGSGCASALDCRSGVCTNGRCQIPTCHDKVKNGREADVDCGGLNCQKCMNAQACQVPGDCASGTCDMNVCRPASCTDNVKNGTETDIDCGGGACNGCTTGQHCVTKNDCRTASCVSSACQPVVGTGTGLRGEYFDNIDLTNRTLGRTDLEVNFNFGTGGTPDALLIQPNGFSIRWNGMVQPQFTETYTFYLTSDDGARLWVDGKKVVDDWTSHTARERSGQIALEATKQYRIHLEYFQNTGNAQIVLAWESPGTPKSVVSTTQLYPGAVTANLTINGDFEDGNVLPWQSPGGATVTLMNVFAGKYSAQLPVGATLEQTVPAHPGGSYAVYALGKVASGTCNVVCTLQSAATSTDITLPTFGASYLPQTSTFTTASDTTSIRVRVQNAQGAVCYVDEISLVEN